MVFGKSSPRIRLIACALSFAAFFSIGSASARPITRDLRKAITLVSEYGSEPEGRALEKLFKLQGYQQIPVNKTFVDGSIGRDSVSFLQKQIDRLKELRPRRPYLDPIIDSMLQSATNLRIHSYLNWGPKVTSTPKDEIVLDGYRFDGARYKDHIRALSGDRTIRLKKRGGGLRTVRLDDRHMDNPDNKLADTVAFLRRYYRKLGYKVSLQPMNWRGRTYHNVVVTIPGKSKRQVLIGAHYDTAVDERAGTARDARNQKVSPGADDNGTGVAALMEAARAFKGKRFERTIKLVHFCGEEQPGSLRGSRTYAETARKRGEQIDAVFVVDSIGYNRKKGNKLVLHTSRDERSLFLGSEIARASDRLGTGLRPQGRLPKDPGMVNVYATDSAPFVKSGIPTVFVNEDFSWRRGLHDRFDTADRLDYSHAGRIVSSTLEAVARVAGPIVTRPKMTVGQFAKGSVFEHYQRLVTTRGRKRDEMVDNRGAIRPHYQKVARTFARVSKNKEGRLKTALMRASGDSTEYEAVPRVIDSKESDRLKRGLEQLERGMQAALRDIYSPNSKLVKAGIVTRAELEQTDGYDPWFVGIYNRRTQFDFVARPDLMRGQDGRMKMIELNMGFIGGLPDIVRLRRMNRAINPGMFENLAVRPNRSFVVNMANQLKKMAKGKPGKVVYWSRGKEGVPKEIRDYNRQMRKLGYEVDNGSDNEDYEFHREMKAQGVEVVTDDTRKKLEYSKGKVFLVDRDGTRERVSVIYSRADNTPDKFQAAHGWGNVRIVPSPGSNVLESKNLFSKLPLMIRHLLNERPVIECVNSRSFADRRGRLNRRFLDAAMANPKPWVFKVANEAQGDGILVGKDASKRELAAFRKKIEKSPAQWDAQEYIEPTTFHGKRIDLAPFMASIGGTTLVPPGAQVRNAPLNSKAKFGDMPTFHDAVHLEAHPRDFLARPATAKPTQRGKAKPKAGGRKPKGKPLTRRAKRGMPRQPTAQRRKLR